MMQESKGNMYSWITHTWNTVKGECPHGCTYCYMKRWGKQKPVRFDESELKTDLGSGNFIFVGSSCDLFADDIPEKWIYDTVQHCLNYPNDYLFQTKNPSKAHILRNIVPYGTTLSHISICTTIESNRHLKEFMGNTPTPEIRAMYMHRLSYMMKTYVTIEPIMDFDLDELVNIIQTCRPTQVNIGADSGNNNLPEPPKEKILALIDELKKFTTIDQKRNLSRLL